MADLSPGEPDSRTLDRLKTGDITALTPIFRYFGPRVHRLSRSLMGNDADAEDATQEIFLRVFDQAHNFDGRARFSTWLYRLAVRHCLNKIKQRRRRTAAEQREPASRSPQADPAVRLIAEDERAMLDALLMTLPPHYRACIVLREIEGCSYARIAELLDVPRGTVMSRLARARKVLQARLSESAKKSSAEME